MRCRVLVLATLALGPAMPGCVGSGGIERGFELVDRAPVDGDRGEGEFWMVRAWGSEVDERRNQAVCSRLPVGFELLDNETLRYDPERYAIDRENASVLVAIRHEDTSSSCPEHVDLVADPDGPVIVDGGQYGEISVRVREEGRLVVDGREIGLGEAGRFAYAGEPTDPDVLRVDGQIRVENLGAWARGDLWARAPSR
jgi:hypothetical protein